MRSCLAAEQRQFQSSDSEKKQGINVRLLAAWIKNTAGHLSSERLLQSPKYQQGQALSVRRMLLGPLKLLQ